jgi:AcrR family transcriptional regulator
MNLFRKKGLKSVTMDELARSLGMSKRTIYENFEDKNALVEACLLKAIAEGNTKRNLILDSNSNVYEAMIGLAQLQHEETKQMNPAFFDDLHKYYANLLARLKSHNQHESQALLERIFKSGIGSGFFADDLNINIACLLVDEFFAFSVRLIEKHNMPPCDVFSTVFVPFFKGISTEAGLKEIERLNPIRTIQNNK